MTAIITVSVLFVFLILGFAAWRRYLWAAQDEPLSEADDCPYSLTEAFSDRHLIKVPHQEGALWLTDIFSRTARKFPNHTALQIPHTGDVLTYAELDARAETMAAALSPYLNGPDQVVAVAMSQDNWHIVAAHLGILKAGGTLMFLDTNLPDALITHMLDDAQPAVVLTRGQDSFRDLPTLDVLELPEKLARAEKPAWLDDPAQRLATLFYTSGTTGMPKGVESHHAGYVNLALSYADYLDLVPGVDATTLTSSLGYDGSISEMYSAWVSGCEVVLLTSEEVRSGPDLLPVLREAEVTVLFCPPVLLTTLTHEPELDLPYPICRYIIPAGEAFPAALVEPWTRARRQVINTYGPTEASTDTSRQSLRPGEPVTIGSPLANVTYVILEVDQLTPLPHGEAGELCIGGIHVGRGYRNLPEQTTEKFITHPTFGRLYRTGDKCRIDSHTQRVHFLGRIDTQLKVRGHRVEVQAVEDILQTQFNEIETAVLDYQNQELVAFVVAPEILVPDNDQAVPAPKEWASRAMAVLGERLPSPSIPSRIFLVENFIMKPLSGKIDRDCLPDLLNLQAMPKGVAEGDIADLREQEASGAEIISAREPDLEDGDEEVLTICAEVFETPLDWDDVFADSGGHSIVIAQLAQRLQRAGWQVSVRALLSDCDTPRKVLVQPRRTGLDSRKSLSDADPSRRENKRDEVAARVFTTGVFTLLQVLFLMLLYAPTVIGFLVAVAFTEIGEFFMTAYLWEFIAVGFLMYLVALIYPFANLLWVMLIKLFMGGHVYRNAVTPGVYPKWSRMHLRIWCIGRLEQSVLRPAGTLFRSAPLMAYIMRRLGANVGRNVQCAYDAEFFGPLDLLTIEDNVAVQARAYIHLLRWDGEDLHIGPVHLKSGCKIGMRAGVANHVTVGRGSWITPFTPVLNDVGEGELWEGAPAEFRGNYTELKRTSTHCRYSLPDWLLETLNIVMQVFIEFCIVVIPTALVTWFATHFLPSGEGSGASDYFKTTPLDEIVWQMGLYVFVTTWVSIVLISVVGSIFLRFTAASPGLYPTRGPKAALLIYRMKMLNRIQNQWTWTITGQYLRALAGLRFTRVGASECDAMFNLVPEAASADAKVFWSNGCFTNMLDYGAEYTSLRQLDMPENFFSGNNCVAEYGRLPANFLLGVSTPVSEIRFREQMHTRPGEPLTVAGNPPLKFASKGFDSEDETPSLPGLSLFLSRVFLNDIFSIGILRITNVLVYVIIYSTLLRLGGQVLISAFLALVLTELTLVLASVLVKKVLVGNQWGSDHTTPFWSWRHFSYFFAQDCFFAWCRVTLAIFAGTVLANPILRWMGCKIGKRTIISSPMQASDWNAVKFGDDCMVAGFLQFHSFENMLLKLKVTDIQDGSTVNFGATVMGGAVIEPNTKLEPLCLVLKEMRLSPGTYEGSPVEFISGEDLQTASVVHPTRSSVKDG